MFTGQGSQYYYMGYSLYKENTVFRITLDYLDNIVKSIANYSVLSAIFDQTKVVSDVLDNLVVTHPAIFMIQYAMVKTLNSLDIHPDIVLGYSLGEYCALTTAGVITPEHALSMILSQAKIVTTVCENGFMYAVLADHEKTLPYYANIPHIKVAAINFKEHFVLSGPQQSELNLLHHLEESKALYYKLPIRYGFHSDAINSSIEPILATMDLRLFKKPRIQVISTTKRNFIYSVDKKHFSAIFGSSLHFQETIEFLENKGRYHYIDIGPTDTLSTFLKYIIERNSKSKIISTLRLSNNEYNTNELKSDLGIN